MTMDGATTCPYGSATQNPCTNLATVETSYGRWMCEIHAEIIVVVDEEPKNAHDLVLELIDK
jgi:hypothetical protein